LNGTRIAMLCGFALAILGIWLLTDISASAGLGFFYAVPVGLATWWGGPKWGIAAIGACLSLYVVGAVIETPPHLEVTLPTRVFALVLVAILTALLRERMLALEHSAEELEAIRAALTPSTLPELPGVDAAAAFLPSEHGVSGDFYLLTNGPDGSTIAIVGDVVGHGPKAARLATFIRARFAALAASTSDPAELLTLANEALLDRPGMQRELVSAVCVRFCVEESRLSWAVAGHPPPLRLPSLEELPSQGETFLLGAKIDLTLGNAEMQIVDDGGVMMYTDGATDVRREGALLGLDGLSGMLAPLSGMSARTITDGIQQAILEWTDEAIRDDLCLLVLRPKGASTAVA
jgi:serine phosphatase RsbU (regulator of sigma subunit)